MQTAGLERAVRRTSPAPAVPAGEVAEACELCGVGLPGVSLPGDHRHLVDLESDRTLVCACTACALLFERPGAALGRYRAVPRRRPIDLGGAPPVDIPVGLAFFVRRNGAVVAHYPSPAGATRWELDVERWEAFERERPEVAAMAPEVEAVLVHTGRGADECWLVPVDACYRLVALVKQHWRGLSGGSEVWGAIQEFFADLSASAAGGQRYRERSGR